MASFANNIGDTKKFSNLKAVIYIERSGKNQTVTVTAWDKKQKQNRN